MKVIKKDGQLKFVVDILLGFKFSMTGKLLYGFCAFVVTAFSASR